MLLSLASFSQSSSTAESAGGFAGHNRWSREKVNLWYAKQGWLAGCNYTPAYAINQLEFWQAETFDLAAIDRELGWAEALGMNTMRVFLHDLAWKQDVRGFKQRIDAFLGVCHKHRIRPIFVFFDDCWNPDATIGLQPAPKPGTHNSGWLRSPSRAVHDDPGQWAYLKEYVQDILRTFRNDRRILMWDLYNEPGNSDYGLKSLPLLKSVFRWAREIGPSQPLTVCMFEFYPEMTAYSFALSDVISYHNYGNLDNHRAMTDSLKNYGRPLFCTEYMARTLGSTFQTIMPHLKAENIAAINWGFVDGKTQTKYQWGEVIADGSDPELWFHDVLKKDGTPYRQQEADLIKALTERKDARRKTPRTFHVSKKGAFSTIQSAASLAGPGDTVMVHEGTYWEYVDPRNAGSAKSRITYKAAPGEKVVIKGSEIVKGWKRSADGSGYLLTLPNSYFGRFNPYADEIRGDWYDGKGWKQHTGAVYRNGRWLMECRSRSELPGKPDQWYAEVDRDSTRIWANFGTADPAGEMVEINVRRSCFYPSRTGVNYITVSGFAMMHAATNWSPPTAEQVGLIGTNWSKGWVIENCDVSYSKCAGITLGKYGDGYDNTSANSAEGYVETVKRALDHGWNKETVGGHTVRNNTVSFCEQGGIVGSLGCSFSTVSGNTIHDIHRERLFSGAEQAAIKFHGAVDVVISGNTIYNNNRGIWLDWMAQGTRITGNKLYGNDDWDIYFEVDHGPVLVDNNVMLSKNSQRVWSQGVAYVHNLIAGKFEVWPYDDRETPVLKPHGTEIFGLRDNPSGDVQLYNNVFSGKDCNLEEFDNTKYPCRLSGNVYERGAVASRLEKPIGDLKLTSSAQLGRTVVTRQGFEGPDGKPIVFDRDFYGKKRKGLPVAGPYQRE